MPKQQTPEKKASSVKSPIGKKVVDKKQPNTPSPTVPYNEARIRIIKIIRFFLNKPIIEHTGSSIAGFCQLSGCQELLTSKTKEEAIEKTSHDCPTGIQCYGICDLWSKTIEGDTEAQDKKTTSRKIIGRTCYSNRKWII